MQSYCALRGQSIRGQLDGTIPSTSEGQRNSSALVDGKSVNLGLMGSMNGGGGQGGGDNDGGSSGGQQGSQGDAQEGSGGAPANQQGE